MRKIRIGAYLASVVSAVYLLRTAVWTRIGPRLTGLGAPRKIGPVKIIVTLVILLGVAGFVLYLMFSGPHMRVEPKLMPYEALLPAVPAGITPVAWAQTPNLEAVRNPVADTAQTRRIGQAYYRDYCTFCHGQVAHGDGPVGRSYVPTPTNLTLPAVRGLSDGALYRGMLTGVGHAPVLDYVVDPNTPWYIIRYVRTLSNEQ